VAAVAAVAAAPAANMGDQHKAAVGKRTATALLLLQGLRRRRRSNVVFLCPLKFDI